MSELMDHLNFRAASRTDPGADLYRKAAAEIVRLSAELDGAIMAVNERDEAAVATFESLETAIDAWHEAELLAGRAVPDFWDDCRTSEMLAQHLTALGWVRGPSVQALVDASGHTPEDAALILDEMARAAKETTNV